jgi:hypothetical protein
MARFPSASPILVGLAVLGSTVILATESASGMKIQTGPLLSIIGGLLIAALGVFWHVHMARTESGAAPHGVAPGDGARPTMAPKRYS